MYHNSVNAASEASGVMNVVNVVYSVFPMNEERKRRVSCSVLA